MTMSSSAPEPQVDTAVPTASPPTTAFVEPAQRRGLGFKGFVVTLASGAALALGVSSAWQRMQAVQQDTQRLEKIFVKSEPQKVALSGAYAATGTVSQGFYIDTSALPPKFCAVSKRQPQDYQSGVAGLLPVELRNRFYNPYAENCSLPLISSVASVAPSVADYAVTARQNLVVEMLSAAAGVKGDADRAAVRGAFDQSLRLQNQLRANQSARAQFGQ